MPILRVARPPWEGTGPETAVNVGSHVLWGAVTALLAEELSGQTGHGPSTDTERLSSRVG
jgi:hypothetical protein